MKALLLESDDFMNCTVLESMLEYASGVQIQGGWGVFISPKDFDSSPPPNKYMLPSPYKNMFPFPKNRLTYTHVTQHWTLDICYHPSNSYTCTSYSFYHTFIPLAEGGDDYFELFGLKGVGSNIFGIKGGTKVRTSKF